MYPFHVCLASEAITRCLFVKIKIVFSRTCAGKRHLKSRERGDRKGVNGGKREGERSERESVVTRLNLSLRQNNTSSFPGHAPGKDTLRATNAATKVGFTGRKQNKRSEFCCLPVISCRYSSAISPVPTAYRSHRVFFLMKNPLCSCMYTPPQSKAVHP